MKHLIWLALIVVILLLVIYGFRFINTRNSGLDTDVDTPLGDLDFDNNSNMTDQNDSQALGETQEIVMQTNKGDISIELFTGKAPITAGNFYKLASEAFYDNVKFHRVIDGFMIQGGDPLSKDDAKQALWGTGGPGYAINDEFVSGLSNVRGTLSMANSGPNTGGSQFFINTANNTFLDNKHAVFGRVVGGMEVVDAISKVATNDSDVPLEPIVIKSISIK